MEEKMKFPKTIQEFIEDYSFKDSNEVYTNGAELVPVFRVEQALEHYEQEIRNKAIDDFVKAVESEVLSDGSKKMEYYNFLSVSSIKKIAEQMKGAVQ